MKHIKYLIFAFSLIFLLTNSDFRKLVKNYFKLYEMRKQKATIDSQYKEMEREKILLDTSDDYLEKVARQQFHLVKPNEYEFRFTPPKENDKN